MFLSKMKVFGILIVCAFSEIPPKMKIFGPIHGPPPSKLSPVGIFGNKFIVAAS